MEQFPEQNENTEQGRPLLVLDLSDFDRAVYSAIGSAQNLLAGEYLDNFNTIVRDAMEPGRGRRTEDMLAIFNSYFYFMDSSGTFPAYSKEGHIMAAIERLNERISVLPDITLAQNNSVYICPSFNKVNCTPEEYVAVLRSEISRVERDTEHIDGNQRSVLEEYMSILRECATTLNRVGVV